MISYLVMCVVKPVQTFSEELVFVSPAGILV